MSGKEIVIVENFAYILKKPIYAVSLSITWTWLVCAVLERCLVEAIKEKFKFCKLTQFKSIWKFIGLVLNYGSKWEKKKYSCTWSI